MSEMLSSELQHFTPLRGFHNINTSNYTFSGKGESTVIPDKVKKNTAAAHVRNEFLSDDGDEGARCFYTQPVHQVKVESKPSLNLGTATPEEESVANNAARKRATREAFVKSKTGHKAGSERKGDSTLAAHLASMVPTTHKAARDSKVLNEKKRAGKALAVGEVWAQVPVYGYNEAARARPMHARDESSRVHLARDQAARAWRDDVPILKLPTIHTKPESIVASSDGLVMAQQMNASMNEMVPNAPHTPFVFQPDR